MGKRWSNDEDHTLKVLCRDGASLWKASKVLKRTKKAVQLRAISLGLSMHRYASRVRSRKDDQPNLPLEFDHRGSKISVETQKVGDTECTTITATEPVRKVRRTRFPGELVKAKKVRSLLGIVVVVLTGIFSLILPVMWAFGELELAKQFSFVTLLMFALLAVHLIDWGNNNG